MALPPLLIADALLVKGIEAREIASGIGTRPHALTQWARVRELGWRIRLHVRTRQGMTFWPRSVLGRLADMPEPHSDALILFG